jgi:hypothetical protein
MFLIGVGCSQKIVCNKPYILVGNSCCLDKDENLICDKDETKEEPKKEEVVDDVKSGLSEQYTLVDLQRDISSVLGSDVIFIKDRLSNGIQSYSYADERFYLVSTTSNSDYHRKMKVDVVSIFHLLDKSIEKEEFRDYIVSKRYFFIEPFKDYTIIFESEFNSSIGLNRYFDYKNQKDLKSYPLTKLNLEIEETSDSFNQMGLISDEKVVEFDYAIIYNYDVGYGFKGRNYLPRNEVRLDLLQAINIYCKPNLIVTLYGPKLDWRSFRGESGKIEGGNILSHFKENRENLLPQVQSIIDMCENKYAYGEFLPTATKQAS